VDDAGVIDWSSVQSYMLLNPRMPAREQERLRALAIDLPRHLWLATSGTTGSLKLTALSKEAMLASAAAVNRRLQASASDVWCCVLPSFHVGGLGIYARAYLAGSRVQRMDWDPRAFAAQQEMTLASLVPAQVSDLLELRLMPPPALRAIVVGGGALTESLYRQGCERGWPLLPSYGMTETCSQVATATLSAPELVLLDHVTARVEDGRLAFRGAALLTGYATERGFVDPKQDGWFITEDLGSVEDGVVTVEGRRGDFVKVGGESVDLGRLDAIVASVAGQRAAVVAVPDQRLGYVIHLAVETSYDGDVAKAFNARVHPFERARAVHRVAEIPRSPLGKLLRKRLLELLPKTLE